MGIAMICLACLFIGFVIGYALRDYELHKNNGRKDEKIQR